MQVVCGPKHRQVIGRSILVLGCHTFVQRQVGLNLYACALRESHNGSGKSVDLHCRGALCQRNDTPEDIAIDQHPETYTVDYGLLPVESCGIDIFVRKRSAGWRFDTQHTLDLV